jgi:hypothetical protein
MNLMRTVFLGILLAISLPALGESIVVQIPEGMQVISAKAQETAMKSTTTGTVQASKITFDKLLPATPYDLTLELKDGTILQGINLGWLNEEPVKPLEEPMTDEDKTEIFDLVKPDKDFFNKIDILLIAGDHNRVTTLVKQIRDRDFHSDKGGEIISRFELWYFRFQYGGWEKVQQGQKLVRRDRFPSREAFEKTIGPIKWTPELGGIKLEKGQTRTITLTAGPGDTSGASKTPPPSSTQPAP